MSQMDVLAVIGALLVDQDFREAMQADPDAALAGFENRFSVTMSPDEKQHAKSFAEGAIGYLAPDPCPWWPCITYKVSPTPLD